MRRIRTTLVILIGLFFVPLPAACEEPPFVVVTTDKITEGMIVYKNPNWPDAWGKKDIHPPETGVGKVRSWSDMDGAMHGDYKSDIDQLQWPGLVCVDWFENVNDPWKSIQAYRIGFADEYWLVSEANKKISD